MNLIANFLLNTLAILFISHQFSAETILTFEKIEDFTKHGFSCESDGENPVCKIRTASSTGQLPSYFPDSYRNLSGDNFMYIDSADNGSSFFLVSNSLPIRFDSMLLVRMEYYTETPNVLGYIIWADAGSALFPASANSTWRDYRSNYVARVGWDTEFKFWVSNDRINSMSVIKKIEIIIDPEPQVKISMTNLNDFDDLGITVETGDIHSVKNASDLPDYFPQSFKALSVGVNENLMYVEPKKFMESFEHELILHVLTNMTQATHSGYVRCEVEFYTEREVSGFGWGKTYGGWSPYYGSSNSEWLVQECQFYHLDDFLRNNNQQVGFYSRNDKQGTYSVFKRLEVQIFHYLKSP